MLILVTVVLTLFLDNMLPTAVGYDDSCLVLQIARDDVTRANEPFSDDVFGDIKVASQLSHYGPLTYDSVQVKKSVVGCGRSDMLIQTLRLDACSGVFDVQLWRGTHDSSSFVGEGISGARVVPLDKIGRASCRERV